MGMLLTDEGWYAGGAFGSGRAWSGDGAPPDIGRA
jgi:hypothetical protein